MSHYPLRSLEDLADPSHATFVADQSFSRLSRYVFIVGLVVLIYDHRLTLETEVKLMWSAKLRPGTYWFFAVRYIALSANIGVAVFNFSNLPHEVTLIEATLSIRVFAMYGRNIWVLWASITFGKHANIPAVPGLAGCHEIYANAKCGGDLDGNMSTFISPLILGTSLISDYLIQPRVRYTRVCADRPSGMNSVYIAVVSEDGHRRLMVLANLANVLTYLGDGLIAGFLSWFTTRLVFAQLATDPVDTTKVQFMEMGRASIDDTLDTEIIQFTEMGSTSIDDESRSKTQAM
ncbi:hypothetical protein B0H14DRAFT_3781166 [Mycena olivaceomarginata]|nr:hypothetical protein B0H14DRAFT_3781166 [Mycena olivaceomarginata]